MTPLPTLGVAASFSMSGEFVEFTAVCPHGVECVWRDIRRDMRMVAVPGCTCP